MKRFRWDLVLIAVLVLGSALYVVDRVDNQTDAQLAGCERGNLVRRQINHRSLVLSELLLSASSSRTALAILNRKNGDPGIAAVNERSARKYVRLRHSLHPLTAVNCEQAVKHP